MPSAVLSPSEVFAAAGRLPRVRLAHLPTPLEEVPRFAAAIGGGVRVFVKRDDCTGLLLGGNKARHNEFLLGDAVAQGCDVVVWGAGVQSNNCRQTAAGCAKLGLECRLYLSRKGYSTEPQGNLLLDYLVGVMSSSPTRPSARNWTPSWPPGRTSSAGPAASLMSGTDRGWCRWRRSATPSAWPRSRSSSTPLG